MSRKKHILVIPDGNRRHARREYLAACLTDSREALHAAIATLGEVGREAIERRLAQYVQSGRDPGWGGEGDLFDRCSDEIPESYTLGSYQASGRVLDDVLRWALTDTEISTLTIYAAQPENLNRAHSNVVSFLSTGAAVARLWAADSELCSQCSFLLVGDRSLVEKKLEVPELAPTVRGFLDATARLEHSGTGVALQVNLLAAYDLEWEINQAVVDGRFRMDRLIVRDPVDVVFRSGCDGRAALSGALPCQTSFSQICLNPAYFPDLDISQISSEIDKNRTTRLVSGL